MKSKQRLLRVVLAVALMFIVAGAPFSPRPAQASYEDAAIFYEELSPHGTWVDYDKYGPVWYPSNVEEDWRPYTNGRWVPSEQGYLFETEEPWGWATYHYGNWMPTENYGWVWVPGRTWYPNTVAWRNSPEDMPVDTSYIGWAPIPPPNYVPPPAYAPPGYYGGPTGSVLDLLTAPFWIFAQASRFLLGFGQPFTPAYSYYGCGCLAPVTYVPVIYPTTVIVRTWYYPSYYQPAYFVGGAALGAYSWGPPVRYVSRVTNINYVTINNYIKNVHVNKVRGGWPDTVVFNRNPHLRKIVPVENPVQLSRVRPMEVRNVDQAVRHLGNPRAIVQPAGLKPLDVARLPKATVMPARPVSPDQPVRVRGMELPKRAQQQVTPQMAERLKSFRPAGAEGPAGPGAHRGPLVGPGPQKGIVGGPQEVRGRRVGPGEGPGVRRGPVEGFQGPGELGVRRGPVEPPEGAKGVRRGPVTKEGFQPPSPENRIGHKVLRGTGERRGPVTQEGFQPPGGVKRGPAEGPGMQRGPVTREGFQPPSPENRIGHKVLRGQRGPATQEGFQPPGAPGQQPRRPSGVPLPEEQRRRMPEQQLRQLEQQHQQLQRSRLQQPPQIPPQQIRQQQEQQRRLQMQQQQEQQRQRQLQQQQLRQQEQQQRQLMQQQQQMRKQQEQQRRQQMRPPHEQSRPQPMRPPEVRHAQQVQPSKKERPAQQSQGARHPAFGER